jgi:hypothetical protein
MRASSEAEVAGSATTSRSSSGASAVTAMLAITCV